MAVQQLEQKAYEMRNTNNKVRSSAAATNRIAGGITKAQQAKTLQLELQHQRDVQQTKVYEGVKSE